MTVRSGKEEKTCNLGIWISLTCADSPPALRTDAHQKNASEGVKQSTEPHVS